MVLIYIVAAIGLSLLSYGFVDPGLVSFEPSFLRGFIGPLFELSYHHRPINTFIYAALLALLFLYYIVIVGKVNMTGKNICRLLCLIVPLFILAYPALSHDLFNYITTSKVAFFHGENPYLIMPIEIPEEPFLAFTRAANKVALYGPVWILLTAVPWIIGGGNIWTSIVTFKILLAFSYILTAYLIYKETKSMKNVLFFALNPLVVIEVLLSGHNDLVMMALAIAGSILMFSPTWKRKLSGLVLVLLSTLVKGSSIVLVPLLFIVRSKEKYWYVGSLVLLLVAIIIGSLREELYPWYSLWFLSFVALLPWNRYKVLRGFSIAFSIGLELRHLPYMYMGYYEGPGPMLRVLAVTIPVVLYVIYVFYQKCLRHDA
jgi:hypothetical protein